MEMIRLALGGVGLGLLLACTPKPSAPSSSDMGSLVERGRTVFATNCTACHSSDPSKDGSLGPALSGSTLELLERRVVFGDYPKGYQPKRATKIMPAMAHLKNEVPALYQYLRSLTPGP